MKRTLKAVVLLTLSFTIRGSASPCPELQVPYFEHVIIVIQENRTPTTLRGAAAQTPYPSTLPTLDVSKYDLKLPPPQAPGGCTGRGAIDSDLVMSRHMF